MSNERWRSIVGWEGYYQVSDRGRVRSVDRIATDGSRRRGVLRKLVPIGCWKDQYLSLLLSKHSEVKCVHVHTEVLRAFRGPRRPGQEARHLDGNSLNNRLRNLRWGTVAQNVADKIKHGRTRGTKHWNAKLDEVKVAEIRRRCAAGEPQKKVGADFGVRQQHVSRVVTGARWK